MIGIIHAYSSHNAGDGLLVELTLRRLAGVGIDARDVVLVALDPDSFVEPGTLAGEIPHRYRMGTSSRAGAGNVVGAAGRGAGLAVPSLVRLPAGRVARALRRCHALVAVGGGYLQARDAVSSAGVALNHLPQLVAAARHRGPTLYLPQSIGPLRGPAGAAVRRTLGAVDTVCVRDRWSEDDLTGLPNVRRVPDLAVLDTADHAHEIGPVPAGGAVGFVARRVDHAPGYGDHVVAVARALGDGALWPVQAGGDDTKSDAVHYLRLGVEPAGRLKDLLAERRLSVVVSVRLHGALMALRAGVPAIHLAYDRKGPAAFADLGLDEWCLDVRSLDRDHLAAAVKELAADPAPYWRRFDERVPALKAASERLDALVAATVRG
ncbi:MAG TPA: polysaccharide pyruvyl transferase family protein [Acidimicrobiales bacterium]